MRRYVVVLGILLIVMVLISGPAIATWKYGIYVTSRNCTNPINAQGPPDGNHASLGCSSIILGAVMLDMGTPGMDPNDEFTVFASSDVQETYTVWVGYTSAWKDFVNVGNGEDTQDHIFTCPNFGVDGQWRFVHINGTSGVPFPGDPVYGPEIDAVGFDPYQ